MSQEADGTLLEDVEMGHGDDAQMEEENESCSQGADDSDGLRKKKKQKESQETQDSVLDAQSAEEETDINASEGSSMNEKSPDVVPLSLTVSKDNVQVQGQDKSLLLEVDSTLPHSSHIEIRIQEEDADSERTETQQPSQKDVTDGRIFNLEVSCPASGGNDDPSTDINAKVFAVVYSCNKCSFCTGKLSELKLHAQHEKHEDDPASDERSENNDDGNAGDPMVIQYACSTCSFKTQRFHTYREHLLTHAKIGAKEMFKCMDCDYTTRHKYNLKTHLKRHAKIGELCEDEVFRCKKCDYVSPYKHDLMTHIKKHDPEKPFQCDQCDFQSIYKHSLIHHKRSKHEKLRPFKCDQCNYSSARKQDLQTHMGRHADEKKFKCDRCSYATPYRVSFKAHMDRHMGNKLFKCEQEGCDFATTTKQNLKSHELRHSTVKPLKCAFCDYTAAHKQQIVNHELKHGVTDPPSKMFKCSSCDYTTAHHYCLQRHMNRHKADRKMPEKDYVCSECGYSTGYKNSLKRHMAKHSDVKPFKCGHCDYSAINMTQMHVHIAKHTGIKPFKCEVCDYATANKQHLVGHMAKHSAVRLKCTLCGFSTAWKQRLRAHLKAHETGRLFQKKDQSSVSAQTGKILYALPDSGAEPGKEGMNSESNDALNEISNAIEAFHSYSLQGEVEVASLPANQDASKQVHENGRTSGDGSNVDSSGQQVDDEAGEEIQSDVEQVELIDEDGNKVSAAVQCINGKQSIEVLVGDGIKKTVALKDLQKDGSQVFIWEQTEATDGTQHIHAVSPSKSTTESESEMSLLVIDEMKAV